MLYIHWTWWFGYWTQTIFVHCECFRRYYYFLCYIFWRTRLRTCGQILVKHCGSVIHLFGKLGTIWILFLQQLVADELGALFKHRPLVIKCCTPGIIELVAPLRYKSGVLMHPSRNHLYVVYIDIVCNRSGYDVWGGSFEIM